MLQAVRDHGEPFVPSLAVTSGLLLAILSLAVLVYFIHHVALSIQATTLLHTVAGEAAATVSRLFPEAIGTPATLGSSSSPDADTEVPWPGPPAGAPLDVGARTDGYVQIVDGDSLLTLGQEFDLLIDLRCRPGEYLQKGETLCRVWPASRADAHADELARTIVLGQRRTLLQDASFAVEQFVEVAVRALSPGINDPFTALACVDHLGATLRQVAGRRVPSAVRADENGAARVRANPVSFPELAHVAFDEIRRAASGHALILGRMLEVCTRLAPALTRQRDVAVLRDIAEAIHHEIERFDSAADRHYLVQAYDACRRALEHHNP
ncbi:MAG: DUF2254 domain-containing protein [Vicinamibacterales bacterium]